MSLQFDSNGHLLPHDTVEVTMEEVERSLVFNEHRLNLYFSLKQFLNEVKELGIVKFELWIDGSFATLKNRPNDIDVICFIDSDWYEHHFLSLSELRKKFLTIDAYFVKMYAINHPQYHFSQLDVLDWYHFLIRDRKRRAKGIVKIQVVDYITL